MKKKLKILTKVKKKEDKTGKWISKVISWIGVLVVGAILAIFTDYSLIKKAPL